MKTFAALLLLTLALPSPAPAYNLGLEWDPIVHPDLTGYRLYKSDIDNAHFMILPPQISSSTTKTYVYNLVPGTQYYFQLRALWHEPSNMPPNYTIAESSPSNEVMYYALPTLEVAAANLETHMLSGPTYGIKLTWQKADDISVIGYRIYQRIPPGDYELLTSVSSSYTYITGLVEGTQYQFKVTPYSFVAEGQASNVASFTPRSSLVLNPAASALELHVQPGANYVIEATTDFKVWCDLASIHAESAVVSYRLPLDQLRQFFRLRRVY